MRVKFISGWEAGHRNLGAHWVQEGKRPDLSSTLDAFMQVGHVIRVWDDGTADDVVGGVYAPKLDITLDAEGSMVDITCADLIASAKVSGWSVENGWSGQSGYSGPMMRTSEFVGGDLAEHVMSTPGYWVVVEPSVSVDGCEDTDCTNNPDVYNHPRFYADPSSAADRCEDCTELEERGADGWLILHRDA
jgi:hypothetical protein